MFIALPLVNVAGLRRHGGSVSFIIANRTPQLQNRGKSQDLNSFFKRYAEKNLIISIPKLPIRTFDRACQAVTAIYGAYLICWPKVQWGLEVNKANIEAATAIAEITNWVFTCYKNNGEEYVAKRLKSLAACCRFYAITAVNQLGEPPSIPHGCPWAPNGVFQPEFLFRGSISEKAGSTKMLIRFSKFSRSLPPGGAWSEEAALAAHRKDVTKEFNSHPEVLRLVEMTCEKVTSDIKHLSEDILKPGFSLSEAACFEKKAKEGGAAAHVRDQLWKRNSLIAYSSLDDIVEASKAFDLFEYLKKIHPLHFRNEETGGGNEYDPTEETVDHETGGTLVFTAWTGLPHEQKRLIKLTHKSLVSDAFDLDHRMTITPVIATHRVVAIPDRGGYKTRVITAGPASLQCLAHNVRKVLYHKVLPTTPSKWALIQDGSRKFLEQLIIPEFDRTLGPAVILNCDLTAATDKFPFDIVRSSNIGLEKNLSDDARSSANWNAWLSLSGEQNLIYHHDKEELLTRCGNLMGTAPSWYHLNMINLSMFRIAWSIWSQAKCRRKLPELMKIQNISDIKSRPNFISKVMNQLEKIKHPFSFAGDPKLFAKITAIVGDDLCAVCPFGVAVIYEVIMEQSNAVLSAGKHYVQPAIEGSIALLAEEFAIIKHRRFELMPSETLRGIVSLHSSVASNEKTRDNPWAHYGTLISTSIEKSRPEVKKALCSYAHGLTAAVRSAQFRNDLPVYIPTNLGGLGWPHPKGQKYAIERCTQFSHLRTYSHLRGFLNNPLFFVSEIQKLKSCFQTSSKSSDYSKLVQIFTDLLEGLETSYDEKGRLLPLTLEKQIGLKSELPCLLLTEAFERFCLQGLGVRYLTNLSEYDNFQESKQEYRPIKEAAIRYKSACKALAQKRNFMNYTLPHSAYVDFIPADQAILDCLYVYHSDFLGTLLPDLKIKDDFEQDEEDIEFDDDIIFPPLLADFPPLGT
jgi:hypothetical protein